MALIFGLSQGQVSHWIYRLTPVVLAAKRGRLAPPLRQQTKLEQLFREIPEMLVLVKEQSVRDRLGA